MKKELFEKEITYEEEIIKSGEKYGELQKKIFEFEKNELELRNQNAHNELVMGIRDQEINSLKVNLTNMLNKHDVISKQLKERNDDMQNVLQESYKLKEDLKNQEAMLVNVSRLTAVHDKCKRRFEELEATIKEINDARINSLKEKNFMISSVRNVVYNHIEHGILFSEPEDQESVV